MFEIRELAQFILSNGVEIKGSILAIPERTELGINLAAAIHLDFCDLRGQPRRDRVSPGAMQGGPQGGRVDGAARRFQT